MLESFHLIRIHIERDAKSIVTTILKTCNLSTEYVDKIKSTVRTNRANSSAPSPTGGDTFYGNSKWSDDAAYETIRKAKLEKTLRGWLNINLDKARERADALSGLRDEVKKLEVWFVFFVVNKKPTNVAFPHHLENHCASTGIARHSIRLRLEC